MTETRLRLAHFLGFEFDAQPIGGELSRLQERSGKVVRARADSGGHDVERRRAAIGTSGHGCWLIENELVVSEFDAARDRARRFDTDFHVCLPLVLPRTAETQLSRRPATGAGAELLRWHWHRAAVGTSPSTLSMCCPQPV